MYCSLEHAQCPAISCTASGYCLHLGNKSTLHYYWSKYLSTWHYLFTLGLLSHVRPKLHLTLIVLDCSIITSFKCGDTFIILLF